MSNKIMAKVGSREVNREPDSQVFNAGGMTRMRSADDSNEFKRLVRSMNLKEVAFIKQQRTVAHRRYEVSMRMPFLSTTAHAVCRRENGQPPFERNERE